jgi:SAM-dependent methyltransferase
LEKGKNTEDEHSLHSQVILYLRMNEQAWYRKWFDSPFYHRLYFERDDREAASFISRLLKHLAPAPDSRMLDVACGKGRHSKILASMGHFVMGIDISARNIEYAKQFEAKNLEFYIHDMRLPLMGNYFDYAFNFFTSFGYFRTRREHDDAIRTIAKSLKPGGTLVIDYLNVHFAEDNIRHHELRQLSGTRYDIHRWDDETHFYKKISVSDPTLTKPLEYQEKVAKFSLGDFTDMLSFQQMQITEVFGDYDFGPYDTRKAPRLIMVAKRKESHVEDKEKRLYSDGRKTDALT